MVQNGKASVCRMEFKFVGKIFYRVLSEKMLDVNTRFTFPLKLDAKKDGI